MKYTVFIPVLTTIILSLLYNLSRRNNIKLEKNMSPDSFVLRPGIMYLIGGVFSCVIFIGLLIIFSLSNDTSSIWIELFVVSFVLLSGAFLIFYYFTYRVLFNEENFIKQGFFRTKIFDYKDTKYAKLFSNNNTSHCKLYLYNAANKKLLSFDNTFTGYDLAINKLNKLKIQIIKK